MKALLLDMYGYFLNCVMQRAGMTVTWNDSSDCVNLVWTPDGSPLFDIAHLISAVKRMSISISCCTSAFVLLPKVDIPVTASFPWWSGSRIFHVQCFRTFHRTWQEEEESDHSLAFGMVWILIVYCTVQLRLLISQCFSWAAFHIRKADIR